MEEALRQRMLSPRFYPHHPETVREVQTHISHVFIAPPYVYKVKKPVDFGFLDFRTLARRCFFTFREWILNRRFSPDLYLEVLPITFDGTAYYLDGPGEQVEYALKMRRFDETRTMKHLIGEGRVGEKTIRALAAHLAKLHQRVPPVDPGAPWGSPDSVTFDCEENFQQLEPFIGQCVDRSVWRRVQEGTLGYLARHRPLFELRHARGFVRECHGDLHTEHIILERETIHIFDCIEFNKRFRFIDTISDLAFLVMELDFLGQGALNAPLLDTYFSRVTDRWGPLLVDFYACYRATVRAKVHAFTAGDAGVPAPQRERSRDLSRRYLGLAARLIERYHRPTLVITMGLSGTGKTTVARVLAEASGMKVLRSDLLRKGETGEAGGTGAWNQGLYAPEARARVYREMFARAREILQGGKPVCLDASFLDRTQREEALDLARETGANLLAIVCHCNEAVVAKRLHRRSVEGGDASDADYAIYQRQKAHFEGWDPLPAYRCFAVDTTEGIPRDEIVLLSGFLKRDSL